MLFRREGKNKILKLQCITFDAIYNNKKCFKISFINVNSQNIVLKMFLTIVLVFKFEPQQFTF